MLRVFLVDDHELVRRGLRDLLAQESDIEVVGEAAGIDEALTRTLGLAVDVVVIDMRLPDGDGTRLCRTLRDRDPAPGCLVLTAFDDEDAVLEAVSAGAAGYLLKQVRGQDLVTAIREVAAGRSLLDPVTTTRLLGRVRAGSDPLDALTEQERNVLNLIGEGMSNREIAQRLFLAEKTIKNHVTSVLAKLGMRRRTQAAAWIVRRSR